MLPRVISIAIFTRTALALMLLSSTATNAQLSAYDRAPAPPPVAREDPNIGTVPPQVVIRRHANSVTREYRANGRLYMIEVYPDLGPSYVLIDTDGDGNLETRRNQVLPPFSPPMWRLFSW